MVDKMPTGRRKLVNVTHWKRFSALRNLLNTSAQVWSKKCLATGDNFGKCNPRKHFPPQVWSKQPAGYVGASSADKMPRGRRKLGETGDGVISKRKTR